MLISISPRTLCVSVCMCLYYIVTRPPCWNRISHLNYLISSSPLPPPPPSTTVLPYSVSINATKKIRNLDDSRSSSRRSTDPGSLPRSLPVDRRVGANKVVTYKKKTSLSSIILAGSISYTPMGESSTPSFTIIP